MAISLANAYYSKFTGAEIDKLLSTVKRGSVEAAICKCCGAPLGKDEKCEYCGALYKYALERKGT